jgi:hypothetical protein
MPGEPRDWKADVDAIRRVLLSHWDPIGIASFDHGAANDEYDVYIPEIYLLMQARAGVEELAQYLEEVETGRMCLSARTEINRHVAERLLGMMKEPPSLQHEAPQGPGRTT